MLSHDRNSRTAILKGLQIEDPMVFISWDISVKDVGGKFKGYPICYVTDSYYTIKGAKLFNTLACNIGLHFENTLKRIEFFRDNYSDLVKSYNDFQAIFESKFGKPSKWIITSTNFEACEWDIGNKVKICHYVMDRFGLAEYLYIEKI